MPTALLIQPPIYDFAAFDLFLQPHGLLRIGRWLEQAGYDVQLIDCLDNAGQMPRARAGRVTPGRGRLLREPVQTPVALLGVNRRYARYGMSRSEVRARINTTQADLVLVASGMTYWYPGVQEICELLHEVKPGAPVVVGGIYASLLPDHCRSITGAHVVCGQAETALPATLRRLGLPAPSGPVPAPAVGIRQQSARLSEAATLRLHEGCPYRCSYCASPILSPRVVSSPPHALLEHIVELNRAGISTFAFYDDALLHKPDEYLAPLLDQVLTRFGERTLSFYLPNAVHLEALDPDLAALMHRAGFREIRFGLESTDDSFHTIYDSKLQLEHLSDTVAAVKSAGFGGQEITAYLMLGIPGRLDTVHSALDVVDALAINVSVSEYSPVPGTPLYTAAAQSLPAVESEPLLHNSSAFPVLSGAITQGELNSVRERVKSIRRRLVI